MALSGRVPRILLVEDSEDDAYFFHRLVRKNGLKVETFHVTNGLEAVEMLKGARAGSDSAFCPDLILLDLKMPDFDGFDVLSWVQTASFAPPLNIAVLSGSDDESDVRRAKEMGAIAFFAKPMEIRELIGMLERFGLMGAVPENLSHER